MLDQIRQQISPPPPPVEEIRSHLHRGDLHQAVIALEALQPPERASVLFQLDARSRQLLFSGLTHEAAGRVLSVLDVGDAMEIIRGADPVLVALWLDHAGTTAAAQIIREFPAPLASRVLDAVSNPEALVPLIEQSESTAGALMTPEFIAFKEWMSVSEAMAWLRKTRPSIATTDRVYIVDMWDRLTGAAAMSDLIMAEPDSPMQDMMDSRLIYVAPGTRQEECARLMLRHKLSSIPVTDEHGTLLGAISMNQAVDAMEEKVTKDMYRLAALSQPERLATPVSASLRNRLPWLVLNLVTIGIGAVVISLFESTIAKMVILAAFIPVVASQGGVGGAQTITLMVRGFALGDISFRDSRKALVKEFVLGLTNGLVLGVMVGAVSYLWKDSIVLGLSLGIAMLGTMVMAGVSGVAVPLGLKLFKVDPAVASMVFVTTITDICGFLLFLGLAGILLNTLG